MWEVIIGIIWIFVSAVAFITGVRILMCDEHTYNMVRDYRFNDVVIALWSDYLFCQIDRDTLLYKIQQEVN